MAYKAIKPNTPLREDIYEDLRPNPFNLRISTEKQAIKALKSFRNNFYFISVVILLLSATIAYFSPSLMIEENLPVWLLGFISGIIYLLFTSIIYYKKSIIAAYLFLVLIIINAVFSLSFFTIVIAISFSLTILGAIKSIKFLKKMEFETKATETK